MSLIADWELLPEHIIEEILQKLKYKAEWRLFMSVCRSWRSVVINNEDKFIRLSYRRTPMLLVPNIEKSKKNSSWSVYSVTDNRLVKSDLLLPPYERPFAGSSEGWIGTLNGSLQVILYKPFDKKVRMLRLPCLPGFGQAKYREWWLTKFVTVTPNPRTNPNDFIIVAIFGGIDQLAFLRSKKDRKWTIVSPIGGFDDVVYHNGQFYAINCEGTLLSFHVTDASEVRTKIVSRDVLDYADEYDDENNYNEDEAICLDKNYLVESPDGELLHIQRFIDWKSCGERNNVTMDFIVSKLSFNGEIAKWERVESLGQCALFLGENASFSMVVSDDSGYQKNCIYFTHGKDSVSQAERGPWDSGIFNLETKVVTRRFGIDASTFAEMGTRRSPIFALQLHL